MSVDIRKINQRNQLKSTVDILNPNSYTQNPETGMYNTDPSPMTSPVAQQRNNLDRQVEVGLGLGLKEKLSDSQKRDYANHLSDAQWEQMQQYKKEGYSFEASKAMIDNQDKMLDPTATGVNKFKDYNLKEQYYNNGYDIDPDSALGKTAQFLQKIGFKDGGNPITALANNYNEWYSNYLNSYTEEGDNAPWLARVPLSIISSVLGGAGKVSEAVGGLTEKADASTKAMLDRAILGLDTEASMYDDTNRSVADYAWEGISGGATGAFWVMAPGVMATFTAIGETAPGGAVLEAGDKLLRGAVKGIVENTPGILDHYASLDEQGKEDMIDSLTTGATIGLLKGAGKAGKRAKNNTKAGKWLTQQEGYLKNVRNLFKESLDKGVKEAKFQSEVEGVNKATAEPVFENGKKVGNRGAFGDTKYATNRVVQAGIDAFKKSMQEGLDNAKRAKTQLAEVNGEAPAGFDVDPTLAGGAPTVTTSKGVVGKAKDIVETRVTGISPEEKIRIQNDPYVMEKWNKAKDMMESSGMPMEDSLITENLYNEIGDKILKTFDDIEAQLSESGPVYSELRNLDTKYSMIESLPEVNKLLDANDIISTPGGLDFSNSKFVSDADMRSVQRALDMIVQTISKPLTPREYLNLRTKLSELAKYSVVDASRGQSLIRQMRHAVDQVAKKEIPGLKDVDKITSQKLNEIKKLKDGWVYKGGDRKGEVRNNFYSIIKNLTGENRKVMMNNLKKYYPGIDEEIEAVHLTQKILKAYNKSPDIIKGLGLGGAIIGGIPGGIVPAVLGALVGEMIQEGLVKPWTKSMRKKAIDKITSEMSPQAKKKLEEIARKQTYAKELSKEDQAVLERVVDLIQKERNRSLSEASLRKRKEEQDRLNQPALPKAEADVVDEKGNVKLARGTGITPVQYNLPRRITEINLSRPEVEGTKGEAQIIQDNLNVTPSVAEDIQDSVLDFLEEIGANKEGTLNPKEVDYSKFSTESLNELYESDLPKTEIAKIEQELSTRGEDGDKTEQEYAYKIRQIEEQEQRIGKVGKNKVNNAYKEKQMREWEAKKERLIEELGEQYGLDANGASDKYNELRDKPYSFIEGYKQSPKFIDEQAERIVLDRLKAEWDKMPKFLKEMTEEQQAKRQDFLDKVELKNGYTIETTPYNDRYVRTENKQIVDKGAIRYVDGNIEITAQDINGFLDSGIINYLPDEAILRISGDDTPTTIGEIRGGNIAPTNARRASETETDEPFDYITEKVYKDVNDMGINDVREGLELYRNAPYDMEARREFLILKQQPGYLEKLGLNRAEVNKQIKERSSYKEGVKELSDEVNKGVKLENQYMGFQNLSSDPRLASNISALRSLVKSVRGPEDGAYIPYLVNTILAYNSNIMYKLLNIDAREAMKMRLSLDDTHGLYQHATDTIAIGKQYQHTASHEVAHYIDFLRGRELFGGNSQYPYYLSNPGLQVDNLTPQQLDFYNKFNEFVDKIRNVSDQNGKIILNSMFGDENYWLARHEVFARFGEAFIDWVKKTAKEGVNQKDFEIQATTETEEFTVEHFKEFIKLIQKKSELEGLKEAQTPANEFGIGVLGPGYRKVIAKIEQQGLFDEPKKTFTEQEMNDAFDKARPKLDAVIERIGITKNRNANLPPYRVFLSILEGYNPDLGEWVSNINKDVGQSFPLSKYIQKREVVGMYNSLKQFMKDPEMKAWVEYNYNQNGHFGKELYNIMNEMENHPLEVPEVYKMGEALENLNNYLYDMPYINLSALLGTYDPDPIEWKYNINKSLKQNASDYLTLSKIYSIKNLLQDYINKEGAKSVLGTFDDEGIQKLVDLEKKGMEQKVSTYDDTQITKIGEELSTILLRIEPDTINILGSTYDPDVDKWQSNIEKVKEIRKQYSKIKVPHTSTLTSLKSKLKELSNYTPEQFKEVFGTDDSASRSMYNFVKEAKNREVEMEAKGTTEAVTQLVALHNMELKNFERQIKNFDGKSPMPSIAVMDPNVPHEVFGDLTLVFGKGTVDPKNNPDNKLYGSDAWTPMFPDIKEEGTLSSYHKRHQAIMEIISPNKEWLESKGVKRPENFRWEFNEATEECLIDYIGRKDLNENSVLLAEQIMEEIVTELEHSQAEFLEGDVELYKRIEDGFEKMFANASSTEYVIPARYFNPKQPNYGNIEHVSNVAKQIVEILPEKGIEKLHDEGYIEGVGMNSFEEGIFREIADTIEGIEDFPNNTPQEAGEIMLDLLVNEYGFDKETILPYVEDIFGSLDQTAKDRPLTPENVVEAMKNQRVNREVEPGSFRDMIEIEGHKLKDVEEARKQNFAKVFQGDWTGPLGDLERRYDNIVKMISDEVGIDTESILSDISDNYDTDADKFSKNMSEYAIPEGSRVYERSAWGWKPYENVPKELFNRIQSIIEQGKKVPIRFAESKPERVVDLYNEVKYVLVPKGDVDKAKKIVKGTPLENKIVEYTPDNKTAPRSRKIKELQKLYGDVFFSMGGAIFPIATLLRMAQQLEGDDTATA